MGEAKRRRAAISRDGAIPDDIKHDIAKVVRSITWELVDDNGGGSGGMCFFRAMTGCAVLCYLDFVPRVAMGGMVYRCGPDPRRDVVAFCGPGNVAYTLPDGRVLGHSFIEVGNDIVDFSVGDWRENAATIPDVKLDPDEPDLPPPQWTASPPDFFWAAQKTFSPEPGQHTPDIGRAWYTGFAGEPRNATQASKAFIDHYLPRIDAVIKHGIAFYALRERLSGYVRGEQRRDPANAIAMRYADFMRLLTKEVPPEMRDDVIYVPRIPHNAAEAAAMASMMTIFCDMTGPPDQAQPRTYAGYTDDELRRNRPAVIVS